VADTKPAARLTITASGEYNNPNTPVDSITFEIEAHMKAYGFQDIKVTVEKAGLSVEATAQLCARVYQLEGIKTALEAALAHWRRESDRDTGIIARLERELEQARAALKVAVRL
jgi:hypothetical protein